MSIYISSGGGSNQQIASNSGWGDFCRWSDSLPVQGYEEILHLCGYGWCQNSTILHQQLQTARQFSPPDSEQTQSILESLVQIASTAPYVLMVNSGVLPDDGTPDDEDF